METDPQWTQSMDGSPAEVDLEAATDRGGLHAGSFPVDSSGDYGSFPEWGSIVWLHGRPRRVGRNGIIIEVTTRL